MFTRKLLHIHILGCLSDHDLLMSNSLVDFITECSTTPTDLKKQPAKAAASARRRPPGTGQVVEILSGSGAL